jgi:hypothetical protein
VRADDRGVSAASQPPRVQQEQLAAEADRDSETVDGRLDLAVGEAQPEEQLAVTPDDGRGAAWPGQLYVGLRDAYDTRDANRNGGREKGEEQQAQQYAANPSGPVLRYPYIRSLRAQHVAPAGH